MAVRVKICGVNTAASFDAAAEAGADWVGFVFAANSPRQLTAPQAAGLARRLPGGPARIGLFVDPADEDIARVLDLVPLQAIQLYAPVARVNLIRAKFDLPVWRAIPIATTEDLPETGGVAAALVIEAAPPAGATAPGGNAAQLDWTQLTGWEPDVPWLLAGGLTPENVAQAIAQSGARAVDVSSGVESSRGVKDPGRIAAFIAAART